MTPSPEHDTMAGGGTAVQETDPRTQPDPTPDGGAIRARHGADPRRRPPPPPRAALSPTGWVPPPPSLGDALLKRWWIVLLLALIVMGAGIYVGTERTPTYTSRSEFRVGPANVQTQAIPGFEEGARDLAGNYARVVNTEDFATRVARRTGLTPADVLDRVRADPVPQSAFLQVTSTGASEADAVALGKAASTELRRYIRGQDRQANRADEALADYRAAARKLGRLERQRGRLRGERVGDPTAVSESDISKVSNEIETQRLILDTAAGTYREAVAAENSAGEIALVDSARAASDDRVSYIQRLGLIGFLAGAVIGGVLALLLARRRTRR